VIIAPGKSLWGFAGDCRAVIVLTGHWATTDDMIADLIAGPLMLAFGVIGQAVFPKYPRSGQRLGPMTIATFSSFWVSTDKGDDRDRDGTECVRALRGAGAAACGVSSRRSRGRPAGDRPRGYEGPASTRSKSQRSARAQ
jgi:hypothetical protein